VVPAPVVVQALRTAARLRTATNRCLELMGFPFNGSAGGG
jgi:hypothetical protein